LNALDRAVSLAQRKIVYERMFPETKAGVAGGKARQGSANDIMSFAQGTAEKIGMSPRTIERAVRIAFQIPAEIRRQLRGTPTADNQSELLKLAEQDERTQRRSVDLLIAGKAKNIAAAIAQATGNVPDPKTPEELQLDALTSAWARAGSGVKKSFIAHLRETGALTLAGAD